MDYLSGIEAAYNKFKSEAMEKAIVSSTKASWSSSGYSVELLPNGSYRVLWDNQIGNLYQSEGVLFSVPPCSDEESDDDKWFFDNAIEALEEEFNQWKSDYLENLDIR